MLVFVNQELVLFWCQFLLLISPFALSSSNDQWTIVAMFLLPSPFVVLFVINASLLAVLLWSKSNPSLLACLFDLISWKSSLFCVTDGFHQSWIFSFSGGWTVAGTQLDINDPRLLSMAVRERHLQEADHDEYADASASGAAFCRSAALFVSFCNSIWRN